MGAITVLLAVAGYFIILFGVAWWAGRGSDNAGFFIGGRQSAWYMVAFAMIGSMMSGVTFVSVPGMVESSGYGYLQMILGFIVGQLLVAYVLVPLFYRMKLTSIYEYLEQRFGVVTHRSGAWIFFVSKMLGAAVRFYLVCLTLQLLVGDPLGVPFVITVVCSMALVWLYTSQGGVKSLIWADMLKTLCLLLSVVLSIVFIASGLGLDFAGVCDAVWTKHRIFFLDDVTDKQYFWKQFLAGVFTWVATNGLDQDMMQRNLSCRNSRESQKNMITSGVMQLPVIALFLFLGTLLYMFAGERGITASKDELFPMVATQGGLPLMLGVLFVVGLVSAAYNAAGSALTALTTSFTLDILRVGQLSESVLRKVRKRVHVALTVVMGLVIMVFHALNSTSVIDAVYMLASYTYGPILGLFAFGILTRRVVRDRWLPVVVVLSPLCCYVLASHSEAWLWGYKFSYELLIMNALFTCVGMWIVSKPKR